VYLDEARKEVDRSRVAVFIGQPCAVSNFVDDKAAARNSCAAAVHQNAEPAPLEQIVDPATGWFLVPFQEGARKWQR
jgi:hypothetical protein